MAATPGTARAAASVQGPASWLRVALIGAAIGLAGGAGRAWTEGSRTVLVRAEGLRPLASLASELGMRHGLAVTYEDLPKPEPGEVGEAARHHLPDLTASARHAVDEPPSIGLRYEVGAATGLVEDPPALLSEAVAAQNQGEPRGSFRLERHGDTYHLVPAAVRAADGSLRPVLSLLDVAIDLAPEERTVQDSLDAVLAAVGRAHGVSIHYVGWGRVQQLCRLGFSRLPADEALERVLERFPGGRWVWRILTGSGPGWRDDYVVHLERAEPGLGQAHRIFEPPADPCEWEALGPGDKPWRRLSMEQAAALIASPAEGDRIAGYDAIVERQGAGLDGRQMTAEERAAVIAALLPLAAAGDSESWYSPRVLASLALGSLHAAEAVPVLLSHLQDDFPRPTHDRGFMLPPAAIALSLAGAPAVGAMVARAGSAGDEEWRLLQLTLRFMGLPGSRDRTDVAEPSATEGRLRPAEPWRVGGVRSVELAAASTVLNRRSRAETRDRRLASRHRSFGGRARRAVDAPEMPMPASRSRARGRRRHAAFPSGPDRRSPRLTELRSGLAVN
ncbi:MAG TPA: hypothetical protein VHR45_14055 [Thermoanaerobaculia bacterium]|nr:hypothetical protein [Thermoanaerobaculia bacterium]